MTRQEAIGMGRAGALSAACFLCTVVIPGIGAVAMLLAPAPILVYTVGRPSPYRRTIATVLIATGLVGALWIPSRLVSLNYFFAFGLPTVIICFMIERRRPFEVIVAVGASVMLVAMACAGLLAEVGANGFARTIYHDLADEPFFLGWLFGLIVSGPKIFAFLHLGRFFSSATQVILLDLAVRLSPALVLLTGALSVFLSLRVFWKWAGPRRLSYNLFGDLSRWSAPEWLVWLLVAAVSAWQFVPVPAVKDIALNFLLCLGGIYFCQGLAIVAFYFQAMKAPKAVRVLIYLIVFLQPELAALLCVAGIFDLWVDFRRINSAGPPAQKVERLP